MASISPIDLLQKLIRCPSVTPAEGGALELLRGLLDAGGFRAELLTFSEVGTPDVVNLFARFGTAAPCLLFAGHTDVVPPGNFASWRFDPFDGTISNGVIYGRGACDMKGGVAAAVAAALNHLSSGQPTKGSIAFLITGDEEGPAVNGTPKLLEWARARGERFDHCLLGEPTNPTTLGEMIKIGRRGSLSGSLTVHGTQGHVAYPHLADNPIPPLLRLIETLALPIDAGTAHFDSSNLELVSIDVGNSSTNIIPSEATATFNIRFNDLWTSQTLSQALRQRLDNERERTRFTLRFQSCNAEAFVTKPSGFTSLVAAAVEAETGRTPALSTTGGTSDARFIKDFCPVAEFGLVGQTMHQIDELASVADVETLTRIYGRILHAYLNNETRLDG